MKVTLNEAFTILKTCVVVILPDIPGKPLIYPSLAELTDDPENEFLYLGWDIEGTKYSEKFQQSNNEEAEVRGSSLFLTSDEGETIEITPLFYN